MFSLVAAPRLPVAVASFCGRARAQGLQVSGAGALEHRPSSCSAHAQLLPGMWGPPGSGIEPVSLALAGGFCTTEPPGNP